LSAEAYAQAYSASYATQVTLFRFFNIFGPFQRPDHQYSAVIPKWIWAGICGRPIEIQGDGTQTRDFTYVDTVVEVLVDCMNEQKYTDTLINLAFGNRISLNEVVSEIQKYEPNLRLVYAPARQGDVKESQNSPEIVSRIFPSIQPIPFKEALEKTYFWLKENGDFIAGGPTVQD
jgi:UDP-glucose 4-epimerase